MLSSIRDTFGFEWGEVISWYQLASIMCYLPMKGQFMHLLFHLSKLRPRNPGQLLLQNRAFLLWKPNSAGEILGTKYPSMLPLEYGPIPTRRMPPYMGPQIKAFLVLYPRTKAASDPDSWSKLDKNGVNWIGNLPIWYLDGLSSVIISPFPSILIANS